MKNLNEEQNNWFIGLLFALKEFDKISNKGCCTGGDEVFENISLAVKNPDYNFLLGVLGKYEIEQPNNALIKMLRDKELTIYRFKESTEPSDTDSDYIETPKKNTRKKF